MDLEMNMMTLPEELTVPQIGIMCIFCNSNKNCMTLLEAGRMYESEGICKALNCTGMEKVFLNSFFCPVCINDIKILLDLVKTLEEIQTQIRTLRTNYESKLRSSLNSDVEGGGSSEQKQNRELLLETIRSCGKGTDSLTGNQGRPENGYLVHQSNIISVTAFLKGDNDGDGSSSDSSSDDSDESSEESGGSTSEDDSSNLREEHLETKSRKGSVAGTEVPVKKAKMEPEDGIDDKELKSRYKLRGVSVRVQRCESEPRSATNEKKRPGRKSSASLFPCLIRGCKKKYSEKEARDGHITDRHLGILAYRCPTCPEAFKGANALKRHLSSHQKAQFVCRECGMECRTSVSLNRHRRKHACQLRMNNTNKEIICEHKDCAEIFADKISYYVHVRRDHLELEKPHECRICRMKFRTELELEDHSNVHNDSTPHVCSQCGTNFATNVMLEKHMKYYHEEEKIQCVFCFRFFTDKSEFKDHLLSHVNERQLTCEFCGLSCLREGTLRDHILSTHPEANMEFPTCKICNKTFKAERFLQDHIRLHTGEFRYLCDKCSYGSMQRSHLVKHMETHSTECKYECDVCMKKFHTKDNLRSHRRSVHDTSKPFPCPICFRRFISNDQLQRHSDQFHGTKIKARIPCNLCKKTFVYEHFLRKHMSAFHDLQPESLTNTESEPIDPVPVSTSPLPADTELTEDQQLAHVQFTPNLESQ